LRLTLILMNLGLFSLVGLRGPLERSPLRGSLRQ
jgi:hypothetical protein